MRDDPDVYTGTTVLKNKFGIRDQATLDLVEREFVVLRSKHGMPAPGTFDLPHLQAIHRHLFQDVYEWAGEIRRVEISKDGNLFQFRRYIGTGMADVHRRLVAARFLKRLSASAFATGAAEIIGDLNYVHPFREGNGRTQLLYLKQLAAEAGHDLDLSKLDARPWLDASNAAFHRRYAPMARCIEQALGQRPRQTQGRKARNDPEG